MLVGFLGVAQPGKPLPAGYLRWSAVRRLQVADFQLKLRSKNNLRQSIGNIGLQMDGNAYDLLSKRVNAVVQNLFNTSASYLDSAGREDMNEQLRYMQTLWDISEVAARRLRKELRANARRIALIGKPDTGELFRLASEEASRRHIQYADETNYGLYLDKQETWERQLAQELAELAAFALPD
ncbi:hypothetical protein GCM10023185_25250 [Hymenobacter saemangeumensis]|uniref:Uncharacterized protein n=1 Tax=Hymenobacter saemangeumensis TaxID=1084522 RepID=A0ABP8IHM2_9BACT